jgi:cytoskeletal protein CcmA (bactofilin family)
VDTPTPEAEDLEGSEPSKTTPVSAPSESDAAGGITASESLDGDTTTPAPSEAAASAPHKTPKRGFKDRLRHMNIYFLLFLLALVIAVMALVIGLQKSHNAATPTEISTQTLSTDAINQLKGNDVKIGDAQQTLSVESNAVFAGRVLVQGGVDVAGALKVGGTLSLSTLAVSGTSALANTQTSDLAVSGNAGIQGQVTIQKSLNVSGGATFGGAVSVPQLTATSLQLNSDLQFSGHINAGGATPGRSNGTAVGSGGTTSVSGTDTAGTVTIGTGTGPVAGCFVTVSFATKFNATPHVVITPSSSDAADLNFYITKNITGFSICADNPLASKNYSFDYIVID